MLKKIIAIVLISVMLLGVALPATAGETVNAVVTKQDLLVYRTNESGETVIYSGKGYLVPYNINGSNYFKLRDFMGFALDNEVIWNEAKGCIEVNTSRPSISEVAPSDGSEKNAKAVESHQPVYIDGVLHSELTAYNIDGNNYFKVRDMAKALDVKVDYVYGYNAMLVFPEYSFTDTIRWDLKGADGKYYSSDTNKAPAVQQGSTTTGAVKGDYKPGTVYGPKLSQKKLDEVKAVVSQFMQQNINANMTDYEKARAAHEYLKNTCEFAPDWSKNQANTAWGALVYHEAQCSGYARAYKALCDAMGLECYYVHAAAAASNPSHQWNVVKVDNEYYIVDSELNDRSGADYAFLVSDYTYSVMTGMVWDLDAVPSCSYDYQ